MFPDTDSDTAGWVEHNRKFSEIWANITRKGVPPADADDWAGATDKMKEFSEKSGAGS